MLTPEYLLRAAQCFILSHLILLPTLRDKYYYLHLHMRKLRLRKVRYFAQGHR